MIEKVLEAILAEQVKTNERLDLMLAGGGAEAEATEARIVEVKEVTISDDEVIAVVSAAVEEVGRKGVIAVIDAYKVKKATEVTDPTLRAEMVAKLKALKG